MESRPYPYADIVERGGLRVAVLDLARENGIDLGVTVAADATAGEPWNVAQFPSPRGTMRILLGHGVRRFSFTLDSNHTHVWASGSTGDLAEGVAMMAYWREGAKLAELAECFPFMEFRRLSQAYEDGNPVETQWDILTGDDTFLAYRPLLLALRADPELRLTFPYFSMWILRLATDCYTADPGLLFLKPNFEEGKGSYTLWSSEAPEHTREFRRLDDLVPAARTLLGRLPGRRV
jgi:hypothetical protein